MAAVTAPTAAKWLRAPGNRGVDQGAGLGCVHREAAEGATLALGVDRRQRGEVRAPAPRRRAPIAGRSYYMSADEPSAAG